MTAASTFENDFTETDQEPLAEDPGRGRLAKGAAKLLLMLADLGAMVAAMVIAFYLRKSQGGEDIHGALQQHIAVGVLTLPTWIVLLARRRLYTARYIVRRTEELRRIVQGCASAAVAMAGLGYVFQLQTSRAWVLFSAVLGVVLLGIEREGARLVFARMRRGGRMLRPVVIVGSNDEAQELALMLLDDPTLGYRVVGFVGDHHEGGEELLGTTAETLAVVRRTNASGVIVAASATSMAVCNQLVRDLIRAGVHVELSSTLRDIAAERLTIRPLGRFPVVYLEPRLTDGWRSAAKRTFDICFAVFTSLLVAPVVAAAALAIKFDSSGPVLFRQVRVGKDGKTFQVWKFRTMCVDAEDRKQELLAHNEADGPLFKLRNDPRVTRVGRFLRKTSLDELPQLVNVLRGEMSIVGPRPALPAELLAWDAQLHARLRVKPGITGMWQVNGRSDASFESYSRLDLYYADNWSLLTDLSILAKTVPAVLFGRGSY